MRTRDILLLASISIFLNGCFATTSASLEKDNFMNKFKIEKDYEYAAKYTYEMFQICRTNSLLKYEEKFYKNVEKAEVNAFGNITIFGGTNYWTNVNFIKDTDNGTIVKIYSYMNSDATRRTAKMVENWLTTDSKECDGQAFY